MPIKKKSKKLNRALEEKSNFITLASKMLNGLDMTLLSSILFSFKKSSLKSSAIITFLEISSLTKEIDW